MLPQRKIQQFIPVKTQIAVKKQVDEHPCQGKQDQPQLLRWCFAKRANNMEISTLFTEQQHRKYFGSPAPGVDLPVGPVHQILKPIHRPESCGQCNYPQI
jgi:hypothetical protein